MRSRIRCAFDLVEVVAAAKLSKKSIRISIGLRMSHAYLALTSFVSAKLEFHGRSIQDVTLPALLSVGSLGMDGF
jgi:hypothetical protein